MKYRAWIFGSVLIVVSALMTSCAGGAPTAGQPAAPAEEAAAGPELSWCPPNSAASGSVWFMSWAENDYEQSALNQMVGQFGSVCPTVTVDLTIER